MTPDEQNLDMLVAELDYENRLLRARNERLTVENERMADQIRGLLQDRLAQPQANTESDDPCPGCRKGVVCRSPKCGRLALPKNHPYRVGN
jgi:hypothetical protein